MDRAGVMEPSKNSAPQKQETHLFDFFWQQNLFHHNNSSVIVLNQSSIKTIVNFDMNVKSVSEKRPSILLILP